MNNENSIILNIPENQNGQRADKAFAFLCKELYEKTGNESVLLSRSRIQDLIEKGFVENLNDSSKTVKLGEKYKITLPESEKSYLEPESIPLDIVFEDDYVIVINKPAGMVVHPGSGNKEKTLVNALLGYCGDDLSGIGGEERPGIVHRLDKDTSGLMVIAKNDFAHKKLSEQFEKKTLQRTYWACVYGVPCPHEGEIELPLGRNPKDRKKIAVRSDGKNAITRYRVLKDFGIASLVECKLLTGRTHQIRVHLTHIGHPIIGDKVYKGRTPRKSEEFLKNFPRQALHAIKLEFLHPKTGKTKRFKTELPQDMKRLIDKLEKTI